jgi:hypothetical protein
VSAPGVQPVSVPAPAPASVPVLRPVPAPRQHQPVQAPALSTSASASASARRQCQRASNRPVFQVTKPGRQPGVCRRASATGARQAHAPAFRHVPASVHVLSARRVSATVSDPSASLRHCLFVPGFHQRQRL